MGDDHDTQRIFFEAIFPIGESGHFHAAVFKGGHFNEAGKYEHTGPPELKAWHYPDELGDAIDWILEARHRGDTYFAPTLMRTGDLVGGRTKANIIGNWQVHVDGDNGLDSYEIHSLGGCVVLSGSLNHGHAHFPFTEPVTAEQRELLARKLKERFDGDSKIAPNDYLRPPCTLNWKSGAPRWPATERTGAPTETRLADPFEPRRVKPYAFADELGVDICTTNGSSAAGSGATAADASVDVPGAGDAPEPVEMSDWLQESLAIVTDAANGGRSVDIHRVVRDCYCVGLSVPETRWVVNQRGDLVAKLAKLGSRDDVLESWKKIQHEWPNWRFRVAAIIRANTPKGIDEESFWTAYPELTKCRAYARSVRVGPWAMLGAALTVVSATIPPTVVLPNIVGDYASANLYVNLVGASGEIKSQAVAAAFAWLQINSPPETVKPGSGQGVAKCFAYVKRIKGGSRQVGKRWTAVAMIPEVDTLTAAGSMTGSSLWAELRSAWSDERVGHDYADDTKSVVLQPRRYRLCMIVGVQPLRAGPIFEDVDAGTPQRFVWFPVDDPGAPQQRPDPVPALQLPRWNEKSVGPTQSIAGFFADIDRVLIELLDKPCDRSALCVVAVPQEVTDIVDGAAREKLRRTPGVDPLDGHKFLCRLKTAAALMRLCDREEITSKDWELAGIIMAVSDRTRAAVQSQLGAEHNRRNLDTAKASGERKIFETRMAAKAEAEDIARVAEVIVAALTKADGHTMTGGELTRAVGRDRNLKPRALDYLEIDGRIKVEEAPNRGPAGVKITLLEQTK